MRVGIDITSLLVSSGGVGRYLRSAIAGLLRFDGESRYRFFPVDFERVRDREQGLFTDGRGRYVAGWASAFGIWSTAAWNLVGRPSLDWVTGELDVFHASDLVPVPQRSGRTVATIYDLAPEILPDDHNPRLKLLHRLRNRDIRRRADLILTTSENTKRDVVRHLDVDPERVAVVHGGVSAAFHPRPAEEVEEVRLRYGLDGGPYVLFVGTVEPRKNLVRLVRAFHHLRRDTDEDLTLVLAGRRGWRWEEVATTIEARGLASRVRFLGYVPEHELPALLTGARALAYPSLYEGFGFPPLEAMACGTPVVASSVSSIPEVVDGAGLLVDPFDERAMADALGRVLGDAALRARLVEAGRQRAAEFPWDRTGRGLVEAYRRVAGQA